MLSSRPHGMIDNVLRPLLFLDVDGPILPFGEHPQSSPRTVTSGSRFSRLSPGVGRQLATLPCDLVWATTWEDEANSEIAPRLGLPRLPVVHWPSPSVEHEHEDRWFGLCWNSVTRTSPLSING
ncbi:hypothetical protein GCM10011588_63250 [Nocardia jinanensis]|uniref:Uncharacterized protein n=1 Tax=Nocardia jinanensis TaxID=382504 RepID=A0A917RX29_9NOCA|nr:hypothetical protein GCM10011588_63250 [Nocardia jinanensis]